MSNTPTPRTDAAMAAIATHPQPETIIEVARELERENAKLRAVLWGCKDHDNEFEKRIEYLANENAKLLRYVQALEEQCDSLQLQRAQHIAKS